MKTYKVTAPLVLAQNAEGGRFEVYQGAFVPPGQSDEWLEHHLTSDLIAEADAPVVDDETDTPAEVKKPNPATGSQKAWTDYAVSQGLAEGVAELKRDQIKALFEDEESDASTEAWHAYAVTQGLTEEDLTGLNRDEVRALVVE